MNKKKILLARPNAFIVDEMKRLLTDSGYEPAPISDLDQLSDYSADQVGGVVISTAVSSTVKEDYHEVTKIIFDKYGSVPVMLATMIDTETISKAAKLKLGNLGVDHELRSVEAASMNGALNPGSQMLLIQKSDISDRGVYDRTLRVVRGFFR